MTSHKKKMFLLKIFSWILIPLLYNCFLATVVYADSLSDAVRIDYQYTTLSGSWKVIKGDRPEYKTPAFNDLMWQTAEVPSNLQQQFSIQPGDFIWYRKWIYLPTDKPSFNLGLELGKIAYCDEVFVNGFMIGTSGSTSSNNIFMEKVRIYQIPNEVMHFGGYNLVAIRVQGGRSDIAGIIEGKLAFGDYNTLWTELIRREAVVLIFIGSFIILGLSVLFFFSRRPKEQEYLFFGLGALDMGIYTFYVSQWMYILGVDKLCDFRFYYGSVFLVVPIFLRFTYELLPKSNAPSKIEELFNFFTKILLLYAAALVICLFLYNDLHTWEYIDAYINNWVIIISSSIGIMYLLYKLTPKGKDAHVMFYGCTIAMMGGILESARQYYPIIPQYMATWGLVIFIFSQAILLANRFLQLHKKVEHYSQTLEKMVDMRTKQVKVMEESRRRLIANISHDLRTPVTSVLGHVELLLEEIAESPEERRTYLKRIHSKMIGLHRLIQDLFELTQIESQQTSFHMTKVAAREIIENIYDKYLFDIKNAGFRFECKNIIPTDVMVLIDEGRLDQVFANLISNAIKYTKVGRKITISCELADSRIGVSSAKDSGKMILLKVADDGIGIVPEHIPNIFERFYRGSDARETSSENSGLGLAIVREIILAHGGHVWIDERVSHGCTVCFTLPAI